MIIVSILKIFKFSANSSRKIFMIEAERDFSFKTENKIKTPFGNWEVVGVFFNNNPPLQVKANSDKSYWSVAVESMDNHALPDELKFPLTAIVE